jgi:hypothetical protein
MTQKTKEKGVYAHPFLYWLTGGDISPMTQETHQLEVNG